MLYQADNLRGFCERATESQGRIRFELVESSHEDFQIVLTNDKGDEINRVFGSYDYCEGYLTAAIDHTGWNSDPL